MRLTPRSQHRVCMSTLHRKNLKALKQRLTQYPPHLQTILSGAVASFDDTSNSLRFTNTATALRELLRELFASISPDQSLKRCSWFTPGPSSKTGVTPRHRILFAVYSYLDPAHFPKDFVSDIEPLATLIVSRSKNFPRSLTLPKRSFRRQSRQLLLPLIYARFVLAPVRGHRFGA
jgi:hypothetical protein